MALLANPGRKPPTIYTNETKKCGLLNKKTVINKGIKTNVLQKTSFSWK